MSCTYKQELLFSLPSLPNTYELPKVVPMPKTVVPSALDEAKPPPTGATTPSSPETTSFSVRSKIYDFITHPNQDLEMVGQTLLFMGKPPVIIDFLFEELNRALVGEQELAKQKQILSNAQNLLIRMIAVDSKNQLFPKFTNAMEDCRDTIIRVIGRDAYNSFLKGLHEAELRNIEHRVKLTANLTLATTPPPSSKVFDLNSFVTNELANTDIDPEEIKEKAKLLSDDLKSMDLALFAALPMSDLVEYGWENPTSDTGQYINFLNRIADMVKEDLLNAKSDAHRLKIAEFYCQVIENSLEQCNYSAAYAITSAFQANPIFRLTILTKHSTIKTTLEKATAIVAPTKIRKTLREEINKKIKEEPNKAIVPFFGMITADVSNAYEITKLSENAKTFSSKMGMLNSTLLHVKLLQSRVTDGLVVSPKSNAFERIQNTNLHAESRNNYEDSLMARSRKIYRKLEFTEKPEHLATLITKLSTPDSMPTLGKPYSISVPHVPDIWLEGKPVNSQDKPRRSYLYMLELIEKSMISGTSLEERFFANEVLEQIKQNIQDNPRLSHSLEPSIKKANRAIAMHPALFSGLKELSQKTDQYIGIVKENILAQKIAETNKKLSQLRSTLRNINVNLGSPTRTEREREATLEKIKSLNDEKNALSLLAEGENHKSLEKKYGLTPKDSLELISLISQRIKNAHYDKEKSKAYREIKFDKTPNFQDLLKKLAVSPSIIKLDQPFVLIVPRMLDIELEYREDPKLRHLNNPGQSYEYILNLLIDLLIDKKMGAASLEERFFAKVLLQQIQQNITDNPELHRFRLLNKINKKIGIVDRAIDIDLPLFSDLKQITQMSSQYVKLVEKENECALKITQVDERLIHLNHELSTTDGDSQNLLVEKIQGLGAERDSLEKQREGYQKDKTNIRSFIPTLKERSKLHENDISELDTLNSSIESRIALIDSIDSKAKEYAAGLIEQGHLLILLSEERSNRFRTLKVKIEKIEHFLRVTSKDPDPIVASYAKSKLDALKISETVEPTPSQKKVEAEIEIEPESNEAKAKAEPEPKLEPVVVKPAAAEPPMAEPKAASLQSGFTRARPLTTARTSILTSQHQRRVKPVDPLFAVHNPKLAPANEQSLVETQSSIQHLQAYLTPPENRDKHDIKTVVESVDSGKNFIGLEIEFKQPGTTPSPLKAFAKNGTTPHSMRLSTTKDLADLDFERVAERISALAVAMAKPRSEFDLSVARSDDKREILKKAFENAIKNAMLEEPPRFKPDTKPTLKMPPSQTTTQRSGPSRT